MVRVDDTVVVGGSFTSVASPDRSTTWQRQNLFAFDATTGRLLEDFAPQVDGPVSVLVPAAYGSALFVGGSFGEVGGEPSRSLAKLSLTTGRPLAGFTAPDFGARVTDLEVQGERVLVAGAFERVGGLSRPGLVLLDAASGRVDADFDAELADPIEGTDLRVHTMDLAPNGSNLVIGGSFTTVRGKRRPQLAVLDLSGAAPRLTGWGTEAYAAACSRRFPSYLRDVDISPDGTYFVVVTSGGAHRRTLCDTAARFELRGEPDERPTWGLHGWRHADRGRGDRRRDLRRRPPAVAQQPPWPQHGGPGAVAREGIAALDVRNGLPLSWNPGRSRGVGVFNLYSDGEGLWMASDTQLAGGEFHGRLAYFPAAGGVSLPPEHTVELPGAVQLVNTWTGSRYRIGASYRWLTTSGVTGATVDIGDSTGWSGVRGATMVDGTLYVATESGRLLARTPVGADFTSGAEIALNGLQDFGRELRQMTGLAYDSRRGRLWFTLAGSRSLYYRYFSPEGRIVGAERFKVGGVAGFAPASVAGMFFPGGRLFAGSATDGVLRSVAMSDEGPVAGTVTSVSGPGSTGGAGRHVRCSCAPMCSSPSQDQEPLRPQRWRSLVRQWGVHGRPHRHDRC